MKKVLLLPFLFIIIACARESKSVTSAPLVDTSTETPAPSEDTMDSPVEIGKVKVYIENTLSMYGYLPSKKERNTDFRDAVNELLIASKGSYNKENVELYLINNKTTVAVNIDNNLDKIDVNSLTHTYSQGRGNSDFDQLFGKILKEWNQDEIIVFIADFIYSPGSTHVNSGLNQLRMNITDAFQKANGSDHLAVNILHLESDFHGAHYYDNDNKAVSGITKRPYYIFIMGDEDNIKEYSQKVVPQLKKYNLKNDYNISPSEVEIDDYSALPFTLSIGQFEAKSSLAGNSQVKEVIVKNSLNQGTTVQLAIAVDLHDIPVSPEYLMDIENYQLNDVKIEIKDILLIENKGIEMGDGTKESIKSNDLPKVGNTSHVFLVTFPNTYKGAIELSLNKNIPEWVNDVSIEDGDDDRDIKTNILKQSQTFGFDYIVEGIYNAHRLKKPKNEYFRITLDIDQEKSGSGIGAIIGWLIGLGIIGIIIFIVIRNKQRK